MRALSDGLVLVHRVRYPVDRAAVGEISSSPTAVVSRCAMIDRRLFLSLPFLPHLTDSRTVAGKRRIVLTERIRVPIQRDDGERLEWVPVDRVAWVLVSDDGGRAEVTRAVWDAARVGERVTLPRGAWR